MSLQRFQFEIIGTAPLLMNNPASMAAAESGPKVRKIPTPEEEAKRSAYVNKEGFLYGPAVGFRSALVSASKGRKFGKVSAPTALKGSVFCPIDKEHTILFDPKTRKPLTVDAITVDSRRVVLKKTIGIVRSRARVEDWGCKISLDIDTDFVEGKAVESMLALAGRTIGFLDFRPERGGSFGRFEAKLIDGEEEIKPNKKK